MHFVHDLDALSNDTIAAVATPPGDGGVAIIRISGKTSLNVIQTLIDRTVASLKSHHAHYTKLHHNGLLLDEVLLLLMRAPKSYTGEDVVEIHCHGGRLITRRILEAVFQAGSRPARPGEFTFRAFMNGKMDLAQAEAVQSLIGAKNMHALDAAQQHLEGRLSQQISLLQKELTDITAIIEAWIDFPEEGLEFASKEELLEGLQKIQNSLKRLIASYHNGRIVSDGIALCLAGSPNVGKSSLMNALLDKERAIVSAIAGTTRDLLEDHLIFNGLNLRLLDTAGIREEGAEEIEQEGIRRSLKAISDADIVLWVTEAGRPLSKKEQEMFSLLPKEKTLIVVNKIDLPHTPVKHPHNLPLIEISAKEKRGIDSLLKAVEEIIWEKGPPARDEVMITSLRHKEALNHAEEYLEVVIQALNADLSPELIAHDLRCALRELGKIIGTDITDDIVTAIFAKFCIGK